MTRMLPTRYAGNAKTIQVKKSPGKVSHLVAPIKGYDPASQLSGNTRGSDVMTAPILKNFIIYENRIECRSGTSILGTVVGGHPIESFVPYFGPVSALLAGSDGTLFHCFDMGVAKSGFTANNWMWTSFANLSQTKYTVMVNGADGVWSWDGGSTPDSTAVTVASITKANPAVCTVAAIDIPLFSDGQTVMLAGFTGGFAICNGSHRISSVGSPVNTFTLPDIDTSAVTDTYTADSAYVYVEGSFIHENIQAPTTAPWINPSIFSNVLSHMNRLWFADDENLAVYYLPIQQKSGTLAQLPLNVLFKRGGTIRAMFSWAIDGSSAGMANNLVIFSSNGECVIYSGTDPASNFDLVGVYRFDSPLSKNCVTQYGGDLFVMIGSGLVPMTVMLKTGQSELGEFDKRVTSAFKELSKPYRDVPGWSLMLDSSFNRVVCNLPMGATNSYRQIIRDMLNPAWMTWADIPARTWIWFNHNIYFGDDSGNVWWMDQTLLSDNGDPINVDVQWAWSDYGTPAFKQYKMVRPYILTDGVPAPFIDMRTDYDQTFPVNRPDAAIAFSGGLWDVSPWDTTPWAFGLTSLKQWNGVAANGTVAAPRIAAAVKNCKFALAGIDVTYETGSIMG